MSTHGSSGPDEKDRKHKAQTNFTNTCWMLHFICAVMGSGTQSLFSWAWELTGQGRPAKGKVRQVQKWRSVWLSGRNQFWFSELYLHELNKIKQSKYKQKNQFSQNITWCVSWEMLILLPVESWKSIEANMRVLTELYQAMNTKKTL